MSERTNGTNRPQLQSQSDSDETHQIRIEDLSPKEFSDIKGRFLDSLHEMISNNLVNLSIVDSCGMEIPHDRFEDHDRFRIQVGWDVIRGGVSV